MTDWIYSSAAAERAREWARASGSLFSSPEWAAVIAGLGCHSLHAWNESKSEGLMVSVFRRGPLRVGFLGFPIAPPLFSSQPEASVDTAATELALQIRLHVVRTNIEVAAGAEAGAGLQQPDAWIDDLAAWSEGASKRRAKDLAFARRATRSLQFHDQGCDPSALHELYVAVVRANGGNVRYTLGYFNQLVAAAGDRLRVLHATDAGGRLMGAAVLAMDGDTGYYLHSAVAPVARGLGTTDVLLSRLVEVARNRGMRRFGLMASPVGQTGLLRFKAKWSDREGSVVTRDRGYGWMGRAALQLNSFATKVRT